MAVEKEFVHPACPKCVYGKIYLTGDRDALTCHNCLTVFIPAERIHG